jgi:hypothetical protein
MKICPVIAGLFHTDGRTDREIYMMNLIVAFCRFAKAPKKKTLSVDYSAWRLSAVGSDSDSAVADVALCSAFLPLKCN